MNPKKILTATIPAIIIILAFTITLYVNRNGKEKEEKEYLERPYYNSYPIMGTWIEISLYGSKNKVEQAMTDARSAIRLVNNICSRFDENSELERLNKNASKKPFKCSKILWDVLWKSKKFYEISNGSFDVTITPLMKLWGFYRKINKVPTKEQIKKITDRLGMNKVVFDKQNKTVFFKNSDIEIDLGGIVKGYAVDLACKAIIKDGIDAGVVNVGGNIRCLPKSPPGREFYIIGIRDPFQKNKLMNGIIKIKDLSLSTSGDYEQYIVIGGKRFTHIINPKTGYPVKGMAAVTVLCQSALDADALSTIFFLNGEKFAERHYKEYPNTKILMVQGYKKKPETIKVLKLGDVWKSIREPRLKQEKE